MELIIRMLIFDGRIIKFTTGGYKDDPHDYDRAHVAFSGKHINYYGFNVAIDDDRKTLICTNNRLGIVSVISDRILTVWKNHDIIYKGYVSRDPILNGTLILNSTRCRESNDSPVRFEDQKLLSLFRTHGITQYKSLAPNSEYHTFGLNPKEAFYTDGKIYIHPSDDANQDEIITISEATWVVAHYHIKEGKITTFSTVLFTMEDPVKVMKKLPPELQKLNPFKH